MASKRFTRRITGTDVVLWITGGLMLYLIVLGSVRTLQSGHYRPEQWVSLLLDGVTQGGVYGLIALGYTMVYGILRMINFAHGEVFMGGAFISYFVAEALSRSGFLARHPFVGVMICLLVSMVASTLIALVLERVAYRPLRRAPRLVPLITAIGASFFLQYVFRGLFGSNVKGYPDIPTFKGGWTIGFVTVTRVQVVVIVAAALMMSGLFWFVQKTKTGKAMRAVAEDKDVAALMGIDVNQVIVVAFAVGAAMAGAAGVLYALMYRQVAFYMGFLPGIKAFTSAVLGGIGNIPGAMLGGLFLGIFESVGPSLILEGLGIPAPNQLKDVISYSLLVLILIFRPTGILGERLASKRA